MTQIQKIKTTMMLFRVGVVAVIGILLLIANQASAQQMIVDDAEVTSPRSFQIESWYGTQESWFQPGVSAAHWLEIAPGIIFDSSDDFEAANWLLEAKAVPGDLEEDGWAYGLVAAPVLNFDGDLEEFFTYVPVSLMVLNDSSVLHFNVGVEGFDVDGWEYEFTTGVRGDFGIFDRVALLTEVFTGNFETPAFQAGLRFEVVPELVEMDVTYGEGFDSGDFPGFNIGIAITPDSMW